MVSIPGKKNNYDALVLFVVGFIYITNQGRLHLQLDSVD